MDGLERILTAPLMIISQLTDAFGLILLLVPLALVVWMAVRRPAWGGGLADAADPAAVDRSDLLGRGELARNRPADRISR